MPLWFGILQWSRFSLPNSTSIYTSRSMERHFPSQDEMFPDIHKIVILKCTFKLCILHSLSLIADKWKEISMFSYNQQINYSMFNCSLLLISSSKYFKSYLSTPTGYIREGFPCWQVLTLFEGLSILIVPSLIWYCITQDIFQIQSKVQPNPAI